MWATLVVRDRDYFFPRTSRILVLRPRFLPSLKFCVWAECMNWCTDSGRSLLYLLSESQSMLSGHATRSWFVFPFVSYCLRSLCAFSLWRVLVHHCQWDVSWDFVPLHRLGKIKRQLQRGVRRTRRRSAGLSSHLG